MHVSLQYVAFVQQNQAETESQEPGLLSPGMHNRLNTMIGGNLVQYFSKSFRHPYPTIVFLHQPSGGLTQAFTLSCVSQQGNYVCGEFARFIGKQNVLTVSYRQTFCSNRGRN